MTTEDLKWELTEPCSSCPYRKDAQLEMWDKSEFANLLANDADPLNGGTFGRHKFRHRPKSEFRFCAGWMMDQYRRGTPSIRLRLAMLHANGASIQRQQEDLDACELPVYKTIGDMCAANGVTHESAEHKDEEQFRATMIADPASLARPR